MLLVFLSTLNVRHMDVLLFFSVVTNLIFDTGINSLPFFIIFAAHFTEFISVSK
jgi:hypothetical protein